MVTDHNAHAWVEVWFPRFGWLPFDPTPDRGQLAATYSVFSRVQRGRRRRHRLRRPAEGSRRLAERIRTAANRSALERRQPRRRRAAVTVVATEARASSPPARARRRVRRGRRAEGGPAQPPFRHADPRGLAAAYRRDVVGYLADQGLDVPPSATPELGATLDRFYSVDATASSRRGARPLRAAR